MPREQVQAARGLYKRHRTWWLAFYPAPGAAQVKMNLRTHDEVEAINKAQEIRETADIEVREQMLGCDAEVTAYLAWMKRDELSDETIKHRKYILEPFVEEMAVNTPRHITLERLQKWFDGRWKTNPNTAVAYLNVIRWWFDWLKSRGKMTANHAAKVVIPQNLPMVPRKRFLRPKEARKVIDDCKDDQLKFCLYCALQQGFRKKEVVEAPPTWFDIEAGLIHIDSTPTFKPKDRHKRTIPMTAEFRDWLRDVYGLRGPYMMASEVKHGKYRYRYDFRGQFEEYMEVCGLGDVTFHDLRRTFASLLVSGGISIYKVAKWLGDTVEQTESTYGHLIPHDEDINPTWAKQKAKRKTASHSRLPRRVRVRPRTSVDRPRARASP